MLDRNRKIVEQTSYGPAREFKVYHHLSSERILVGELLPLPNSRSVHRLYNSSYARSQDMKDSEPYVQFLDTITHRFIPRWAGDNQGSALSFENEKAVKEYSDRLSTSGRRVNVREVEGVVTDITLAE